MKVEGTGDAAVGGHLGKLLRHGVEEARALIWGLGFRVCGLGFEVRDLGFGVWGRRSRILVEG